MPPKFQVYKDVAGKTRFRLRASNGQIVAVGEAYEQHASCINGIKSVQKNCNAEIEDMTIVGKRISNPKYQVFEDKKGEFRFHLKAANGEIIAQGEGYKTKGSCLDGINVVRSSCNAEIEDETISVVPAVVAEPKIAVPPAPEATLKAPEVPIIVPPIVAEPPVETSQSVAPSKVEIEPATSGPAETALELRALLPAQKGERFTFEGRLFRSDTGAGIAGARIDVWERDQSLLGDDYLAYGKTANDGSFSILWKARSLTWRKKTANVYAAFKGNNEAKRARSKIQPIVVE